MNNMWVFLRSCRITSAGKIIILSVLIFFLLSGCGGAESPATDPTPAGDIPESQDPDPVNRAIQLQWDPPIEREDSSALSMDDIGGYEINFRREGDRQFRTYIIDDSTANTYRIDDLEGGRYEIFIYAFDVNNLYSLASSMIEVTI